MSGDDPLAALRQPRRKLRGPFMLTPLIDVLFLLLIFFMLSSQTSPFAMLAVSTAREAVGGQANAAPTSNAAPQLLMQVDNGRIVINGEPIDVAQASSALGLYEPASPVVVLIGRSATVQDAVQLLEALATAGFTRVRVAARGGI